jgi:hypothetical protein
MAVEKGLYQAPMGIAQEIEDVMGEPDLEIEIEDPESVSIKAGGLEIEILPPGEGEDFYENIAEEMDENTLQSLGMELLDDIQRDRDSRKDWETAYKEGLTLRCGYSSAYRAARWVCVPPSYRRAIGNSVAFARRRNARRVGASGFSSCCRIS